MHTTHGKDAMLLETDPELFLAGGRHRPHDLKVESSAPPPRNPA